MIIVAREREALIYIMPSPMAPHKALEGTVIELDASREQTRLTPRARSSMILKVPRLWTNDDIYESLKFEYHIL